MAVIADSILYVYRMGLLRKVLAAFSDDVDGASPCPPSLKEKHGKLAS
jgi:hypothetical protein